MSQTTPPLDYGCTPWLMSSQKAADLYGVGVKLWRKEDLKDIEHQLSNSYTLKQFTVRRIDGSTIEILNPFFQVQKPIWKPYVEFQNYWHLVNTEPLGPPETYLCSYLIEWINETEESFSRELITKPLKVFDYKTALWRNSEACQRFISLVNGLVGARTVKKVLCFGLGDVCRAVPEWIKQDHGSWKKEMDVEEVTSRVIQHVMALTTAEICKGDGSVQLLTQDPDYSKATRNILSRKGLKVVGIHGAEGFAEIDEEKIVISPFTAAPVKQIIADLGRPVLILCTGPGTFNYKA